MIPNDDMRYFAQQIVLYVNKEPSQPHDRYSFEAKSLTRQSEVAIMDDDILCGFYSPMNRVSITVRIRDQIVSKLDLTPNEFCPVFSTGQCLPLVALSSYNLGIDIEPRDATVECFIGRIHDDATRFHIWKNPWKYKDTLGKIIIRCPASEIVNATHFNDIAHIDDLPNLQAHVDACMEEWRQLHCRQFVEKILQDLMERTWHPQRHIDWCLDSDDKEMLFGSEKYVP